MGAAAAWACVERRPGAAPAVRWIADTAWTDRGAALRALRQPRTLHRRRCVAVLPRADYQVVPMDAPDVPRDEWQQAVRWSLKDSVEFAVERAAVQLLELPSGTGARQRTQLLAVAAPLEPLARLVRAGDEAGAPWTAIDIVETALRNICTLVAAPGQVLALLHVGAVGASLVITAQGELLLTRRIALDLDQLQAHEAADQHAAFDRAGLELQRTMDSFERQFSHLSLARLLVSPTRSTAAFCSRLRELLYVPVAPLELGDALDTRAVPALADADVLSRHLCAIGAALRDD
jgi:MSHA biogenesis protein MshI